MKATTWITFFVASSFVSQVHAADVRELMQRERIDLVVHPAAVEHVIVGEDRDARLRNYGEPRWEVYESKPEKVRWSDRNYLWDPRKLSLQTVYFNFDSDSAIDSAAAIELIKPYKEQKVSFLLVGHADEVGTYEYNQSLSLRRAEAIKQELTSLGFEAKRLVVEGRGKTIPISATDQRKNRRVEVLVLAGNDYVSPRREPKHVRVSSPQKACSGVGCGTATTRALGLSNVVAPIEPSVDLYREAPVEMPPTTFIPPSAEIINNNAMRLNGIDHTR